MSTYTISLKGDTTENWEASDRVLVKNEVGVERDDNNNVVGIKIGDGTNGWNSLGYVYGQYSETPIRVGTWIDGTPVWRVAFPYILMENNVRHLSVLSQGNKINVIASNLIQPYVKTDSDFVLLLNIALHVYTERESWMCLAEDIDHGLVKFCEGDALKFEDYITDGNGYWGGYIDFVTDAENINTGDDE